MCSQETVNHRFSKCWFHEGAIGTFTIQDLPISIKQLLQIADIELSTKSEIIETPKKTSEMMTPESRLVKLLKDPWQAGHVS